VEVGQQQIRLRSDGSIVHTTSNTAGQVGAAAITLDLHEVFIPGNQCRNRAVDGDEVCAALVV